MISLGRNTLIQAVVLSLGLLSASQTSAQSGKIPYSPTSQDQLPDAILGKASVPAGAAFSYFNEDPATTGYLALPEGEGPHGAVILIHEWNGLNDRIRQVADALAAEGYVALAADLYSGRTGSNRDENMKLVNESLADMGTIVRNLDAAARYLKGRDDVNGKVAAMGWCYGGGVALSYALGSENHEGTAIFYGRLLDDPIQMKRIHHEVYGTFAEKDGGIPPETVNNFVAALRTAGIENDVHIYDEVGHGFWLWVDRNPAVNEQPALDAWQRLKAYLKRTIDGNG
ncbi:MAG: dienelactone hydrolase family protein [Candidatus Latescibacteria bacterium]|jgi:carboxymethylenebutenolidase|nr:dienelactone hydrolase family protein [Candidatus Latescibacterota bacterium]